MTKENLYLGKSGEKLAVEFLEKNGYKIWERNYRTKLGEIDIIAKDKDTICFIEVKSRTSDRLGSPAESVLGFKQRRISRAALVYLKEKNLLNNKARFDLVSVISVRESPEIVLMKNAFELDSRYSY